ncbi:hypothetical protein [uncultured Algibacter sp.]|nr:hypothetical protein [uncultured Algibacter sp.]
MLYNKDKKVAKKRSYDYLHAHNVKDNAKKRPKKGRVMLNGKPKKRVT